MPQPQESTVEGAKNSYLLYRMKIVYVWCICGANDNGTANHCERSTCKTKKQ